MRCLGPVCLAMPHPSSNKKWSPAALATYGVSLLIRYTFVQHRSSIFPSRRRLALPAKFYLGDVVQMRKPHPCGDDRWEVLRTGMDFRIKCLGCGRVVMLPRRKFEKQVK